MEDTTILKSGDSTEYFDTDKFISVNNKSTNKSTSEKINNDAVNQVNSLLGLNDSSNSKFENIPTTTDANLDNEIESVFRPQIIIGKGSNNFMNTNIPNNLNSNNLNTNNLNSITNNSAEYNTAFTNDGMTFKNTMAPTTNLWGTHNDYDNSDTNWTQSMNDYNTGKWNPQLYQKPSDYTDFYEPSAYGMSSPHIQSTQSTQPIHRSNFESVSSTTNPITAATTDSQGQTKKLCGAYDDLSMEQSGNLVVKNYTQAKKWMPGYTYVPPVYWNVPQRHVSICQPAEPNVRKLTGLIDRGMPINALELNFDGSQAQTEDTVTMTNVGSMLPRFNYQEEPFSKPYV